MNIHKIIINNHYGIMEFKEGKIEIVFLVFSVDISRLIRNS